MTVSISKRENSFSRHCGVARIADDELAVEHRLAESRRQIVEHDDLLAGLAELPDDVRADVARTAQ